jgi:hypothetical protein
MKSKCGQEADHTVRDCFGNLGQSLMLCYLCISQSIDTAADALNHTSLAQAADLYPGDFILFKIARAYHALPAEQIKKSLLCREIHGNRLRSKVSDCRNIYLVFGTGKQYLKIVHVYVMQF